MELKQAKEIINEALNIAIKKGCFGLNEVQIIIPALVKINELDDIEFGEIATLNTK
jgi:hypothetical protein